MALRKLSEDEVKTIAGPEAVWPEMTAADVFQMVSIRVRGGSTGKPDRLQEQDRWTKLLPVIEKAMAQVSQLRIDGQEDMAQAVIALVRETLRRFDERIEIERFLPEPKEGEEAQGQAAPQIPPEVAAKLEELAQLLQEKEAELQKAQQALLDKQGEIDASVEKAKVDAMAKVRVAEITAPIEAEAKVRVAEVSAQQTAQVQMHAKGLEHENERDGLVQKQQETSALDGINEQIAAMAENQQALGRMLAEIGAPKPRMKVVHQKGPDGRVAESRLVPDEAE
jgi:hypothetical protein